MAYTVRDSVIAALEEIGAIDPVDGLEAEDGDTGLHKAQLQADSWAGDRLLLFTTKRVSFVLTPNQAVSTLGDGGTLDTTAALGANTPRPAWLGDATVTPVGDVIEYPLVPWKNRAEWDSEPYKTLTELFPRRFWYDKSWPLGTLTWWPVPTTACTVTLPLPVPLVGALTLDTVLTFPPLYQEAWELNLAKRLCRPMRKKITPELAADAAIALGKVKRENDEAPPLMRIDPALTGNTNYDIRTNRYRSS